jgi:pyruvate,orthophosphate dikinase
MAEDGMGKLFFFGGEASTTQDATIEDVGSKAHGLMRMSKLGLPVPPGLVLSTHFCEEYYKRKGRPPTGFQDLLESNIRRLENATRLTFGGSRRPLLVSVRSGAAVSMPGMMDTILNIGLCEATLKGLVRMTGNPRFAWDSYRRLVQAFAEIVHGCPSDQFDEILKGTLSLEDAPDTNELDVAALEGLTNDFLDLFITLTEKEFPQRPLDQLVDAVEAVFRSWESPRAIEFRRINDLKGLRGTAVTIQTMVFGNMGSTSGSGVAFTRDPATGENKLYMDFMFNAQGEDVVSGRRTVLGTDELSNVLPKVYREIHRIRKLLEIEFKDVLDLEFTVQNGELFMLQSRTAKRTPWAALRIAVDLVNEGIIDQGAAFEMLRDFDLRGIERVRLASKKDLRPLSVATPASPGVAVGQIILDPEEAQVKADEGVPVILVREDTSTSDLAGMVVSTGILTARGGRTSHAAVVARQLDKVCIVGCRDLRIDLDGRRCMLAGRTLPEGEYLSLDGNNGSIYEGKLDVVVERPTKYLAEIDGWKGKGKA